MVWSSFFSSFFNFSHIACLSCTMRALHERHVRFCGWELTTCVLSSHSPALLWPTSPCGGDKLRAEQRLFGIGQELLLLICVSLSFCVVACRTHCRRLSVLSFSVGNSYLSSTNSITTRCLQKRTKRNDLKREQAWKCWSVGCCQGKATCAPFPLASSSYYL